MSAEWEEQSGVMIIWPHEETDWKPYLEEITETYLQMADAITRYEKLLIAARNPGHVRSLMARRLDAGQMDRIRIYACDNNDTWARDVAPIAVVAENDAAGVFAPIHLMDFCFNGWGKKFAADKDNAVNRQLYRAGAFNAPLENHKDFVLEGGSIESDGARSLFTTTACLTAPHRNQPLGKDELEKRLLLLFPHLERVVWIDHGELQGDDTDGHIDTIMRCAPNDTLLYISCDDPSDPHYDDLCALDKQAHGLRTLDGKPYRCLKLPIPSPIYDDGDRLPATYANYLVINGAVIVPTYGQPGHDQRAMDTIAQAFPGRDIIGIDATTVVRQHGSLHCLTMQLPKGCLA